MSPELERALFYFEPINPQDIEEIEDSFEAFTFDAFEKSTRERYLVVFEEGYPVSILGDGTNEADYLAEQGI